MLKLTIIGCTGRMGQFLLREANQNPNIEIVGALTRPENPFVGQDVGHLIGEDPLNISITDRPEIAFKEADILIDFSRPEGLRDHLSEALKQQKPYMACMTGLKDEQIEELKKASFLIPILMTPNTSLGVALLRKLSVLTAQILGPSYDVSLLEMHHRKKADSPSGTSLSLAQSLLSVDFLKNNKPPYPSHSPRPTNTIECAVLRGGGVAGDHSVIFAGENEVVTLEHRTLTPKLFAQGAIRAAEWLYGKPPGFYTMDDVIGISGI
jgi:4-hydroxy-tetrahydrodipicolinate reductase